MILGHTQDILPFHVVAELSGFLNAGKLNVDCMTKKLNTSKPLQVAINHHVTSTELELRPLRNFGEKTVEYPLQDKVDSAAWGFKPSLNEIVSSEELHLFKLACVIYMQIFLPNVPIVSLISLIMGDVQMANVKDCSSFCFRSNRPGKDKLDGLVNTFKRWLVTKGLSPLRT